MTGMHIKKDGEGAWHYPNHEFLERKCGLFSIQTHIKRRRGTLRKCIEENRKGILEETEEMNAPATNAGKTL